MFPNHVDRLTGDHISDYRKFRGEDARLDTLDKTDPSMFNVIASQGQLLQYLFVFPYIAFVLNLSHKIWKKSLKIYTLRIIFIYTTLFVKD